MTPRPIERLKPYFKPRRRGRAAPTQPQAAQPPQAAPPQPAPAQAAPAAPPPPAPAPQQADGLAGRREQLAGRYRELESELGGLVYEMAIRDHFRLDVVVRRAAELQAVDAELTAVEQSLGIATATPSLATCPKCGTMAPVGAAFCGRCGAALRAAGQPADRPPTPPPASALPAAGSPTATAPAAAPPPDAPPPAATPPPATSPPPAAPPPPAATPLSPPPRPAATPPSAPPPSPVSPQTPGTPR